jgi:hypothetical protein
VKALVEEEKTDDAVPVEGPRREARQKVVAGM